MPVHILLLIRLNCEKQTSKQNEPEKYQTKPDQKASWNQIHLGFKRLLNASRTRNPSM